MYTLVASNNIIVLLVQSMRACYQYIHADTHQTMCINIFKCLICVLQYENSHERCLYPTSFVSLIRYAIWQQP